MKFNSQTVFTVIKLVFIFLISLAFGFVLGSLANAQTRMNPRIVLSPKNSVVLRGVIDSESVSTLEADLVAAVLERGGKDYTIYLVVDSPGGEITSGLAFIEFAKTINNLSTVTLFSASMASAIVQALPGERLVAQNGIFMFHRAQGGFEGYFENGEVESRLSAAKSIVQFMERNNANRMLMSIDDYKKLSSTELWLFGDNTILYRAADKQVDIVCTEDLIKQLTTMSVNGGLFGLQRLEFMFSGCPLFRAPVSQSSNVVRYLVPSLKDYKITNLAKVK